MRNRYVLAADLIALCLCVLGAFVLRLDWFFGLRSDYTAAFRFFLLATLAVKPAVFMAFGLYRRYWRYVGVRDLQLIFLAVSAASTAMAVVVWQGLLLGLVPFFPRSVLAIDWLLTLACVAGIRLAVRLLSESRSAISAARPHAIIRRVLVVGAGDAGALVVREMQRNPGLAMHPVGFLDDQRSKQGQRIYGIPVLGELAELEPAVQRHEIDRVIVAMPTADGGTVRAVLDGCQRAGVEARIVPGVFEMLESGASASRLREIDIADLLRRRQIVAKPQDARYLSGRTVLVTGGGGSIGSELCRQLARNGVARLILVGHGENSVFDATNRLRAGYPQVAVDAVVADIRDAQRIETIFARFKPEVVFHAAAHKHVPLMEDHPEEAVTNNVLGTQVVTEAALRHGVHRLVLISTDKAVAPSSVMGATKRVAEAIVRRAALFHRRAFVAVRFGNVLGSRGSVVPVFKQQIERGGPVTVTHPDMRRFFMTIPEAVHLVLKAGGLAHGGELFVLNMGEPVRIVDLATDVMRLSGIAPGEISIEFTGLRPGEKLEEELWEAGSEVAPVDDAAEVFRVVEPGAAADLDAITGVVEALAAAAAGGDHARILRALADAVHDFGSAEPPAPPTGAASTAVH